jgi:hypothetical protein
MPRGVNSDSRFFGSHAQPGEYLQLVKLHFPLVNRGCLQNVLAMDGDAMSACTLQGGKARSTPAD